MAAEHTLPAWTEITRQARASLEAARTDASDARDWLTSDWRPGATALTPEAGQARSEALQLIGQITDLVDQAKNELARAEGEQA